MTSKVYGTSDEAVNLMKSGEYDVIAASGDASLRLVAAGDVAPVNTDLLENYDGIFDFLKNQAWNSVDGVLRRAARLRRQPADVQHRAGQSRSHLVERRLRRRRAVRRQGDRLRLADLHRGRRGVPDGAQPELGIENPYALDADQLAAAVDLLKAQREHIGEYWSDYLKEIQAFESGDSVVGTTWQVIQNSMTTGNTEVVLPEEGTTGWSDTWMIASAAENPNCAYAWLDYIADPETNAQATGYFGEAPSSEAACDFREDCEAFHAGDEEYASQIWYWSTPIAECLDGRTDVECTDYSEWTTAWQEIKG